MTTYLFFLLLAIPVAVLTDLGEEFVTFLVAAIAYVLAAIVVWSDVPWPGDPK